VKRRLGGEKRGKCDKGGPYLSWGERKGVLARKKDHSVSSLLKIRRPTAGGRKGGFSTWKEREGKKTSPSKTKKEKFVNF